MKNINEQFEDFNYDELEFDEFDSKYLLKAIMVSAFGILIILGILYWLLTLTINYFKL